MRSYSGRMTIIRCVNELVDIGGKAYKEGHRDARHAAAEIGDEADIEIGRLKKENRRLREQYQPAIKAAIEALEDAVNGDWIDSNPGKTKMDFVNLVGGAERRISKALEALKVADNG